MGDEFCLSDKITEGKMHQFDHTDIVLAKDIKEFIKRLKVLAHVILTPIGEKDMIAFLDKLAGEKLI